VKNSANRAFDRKVASHVGLDEAEVRMSDKGLNVGANPRGDVVNADNTIAAGQEVLTKV
jgi:hypothetical protein